ncbi:GNAT family N-acetyltransferase [Nocardioides sp. KIGAM211]|uniref:GNAT family N-acetyltransferase n=1 Tax=Nocardioides luti TaxID=2761101 RepID=A0A7X0RGD1_9ACTN|nr:GNAT family N-acetyltransferase [Nocardioides luti]MBB6627828.1 GNAT family N-acetyltransferase [Nocardioides luti]
MTLPQVVTTERLRLALLAPDEAADIVAGRRRPGWHPDFPRQDDRDGVSMHRAGDPWGSRTIVRGVTVLGTIGFFGPPDEPAEGDVPEAEVGYGLVGEARGWGFATEALRALLAETDRAGVRVRASVEPANKPSIRVLAKCGFTELRGSDEDGNLVMARPLTGPTGG